MLRPVLVVVLALGLVASPQAEALADECSQAAQSSGVCVRVSTTLDDSGVTVGASTSTPGSPGATESPPAKPPTSWWSPPPPREPELGTSECEVKVSGYCRAASPSKNPPPTVIPPTPPSSANDLVGFSPGSPQIVVEPGSWSIPRVPTNIFARVRETREVGELLGFPIEIRFTPSRYEWAYGDGARASRDQAGSSWGGRQFSPTATAHTYSYPGRYRITLRVGYEASYRFDGGSFSAIPGVVWRDAGATTVSVLRVSRALVDRGCGPGSLVEGRC